MSVIRFRERKGLGPGVDPHFEVRVGRMLVKSGDGRDRAAEGSGYLEFVGSNLRAQLAALFEIVHARADARLQAPSALERLIRERGAPLLWLHVKALRSLTTLGGTSIAMPLHDFNPPPPMRGTDALAAAAQAFERLERIAGAALSTARQIGVTVDFDFGITAELVGRTLDPASAHDDDRFHTLKFGRSGDRGRIYQIGASTGFSPQLQRAMRELRTGLPTAQDTQAMQGDPGYGIQQTGAGAIVGVVDFGCDFAHPSFRKGSGLDESRILALWDQNDAAETLVGPPLEAALPPVVDANGVPCEFGYGRMFLKGQIDRALKAWIQSGPSTGQGSSEGAYERLGYHPDDHHYTSKRPSQPQGPLGAHGTCVLEIAAGAPRDACRLPANGRDLPSVCGVASNADIVFVQVRIHPQDNGLRILDLNDVVDGVAFIFNVAEQAGKPCAVNLSLNTMSGPHDGDGIFERQLSSLLRSGSAGPQAKGRAVVVAAGNLPNSLVAGTRWQHLADTVSPGAAFEFFWVVAQGVVDKTPNSVEIWYDAADTWLQVSLVAQDGTTFGPVSPGSAAELVLDGRVCGSIIGSRYRPTFDDVAAIQSPAQPGLADLVPGRHVVFLELDPELVALGTWKVVLQTTSPGGAGAASSPVAFDAWLERDDDGPSGLARSDPPTAILMKDRATTIGTLSCGTDAIVVGAYDTTTDVAAGTGLSGLGPTRKGALLKPDISAPGNGIHLVRSGHGGDPLAPCAPAGGTSMAAPFVTGTIACLYEANPQATLAEVRAALTQGARPPLDDRQPWSPEFGAGRLDPVAAVGAI